MNEYEKAKALLNESVEILRDCGYKSNLIVALMFLGNVSIKTGEYENAVKYYKESVLTGNETGNSYYLASNLYGLGSAYYELKDFETSLKYFAFVKKLTEDRFDPVGNERKDIADGKRNNIKEILGEEKYTACMSEALKLSTEEMIKLTVDS